MAKTRIDKGIKILAAASRIEAASDPFREATMARRKNEMSELGQLSEEKEARETP